MKKLLKKVKQNWKKIIVTTVISCIFIFFIFLFVYNTHLENQKEKYWNTNDIKVYQLIPLFGIEHEIPRNFFLEKSEACNEIYFKFYFITSDCIHGLKIENENIAINYKLKQGSLPYVVAIGKRIDLKKRNFSKLKFVIYINFKTIWSDKIRLIFERNKLLKERNY
jgi:hypothetical protein